MKSKFINRMAMGFAVLLMVAFMATLSSYAETIGAFTYSDFNSQKKTVTITGFAPGGTSNKNILVIPSEVKKDGVTYSVTKIGQEAFSSNYSIQTVTIPESVTEIGNYAFWGCDKITSINIPKSVVSIGLRAFWSANGRPTITFDDANPVLAMKDGAIYRKSDGYLMNAVRATAVPYGVKTIPAHAFESRFDLTSIELADSVESIGENAFDNCISMNEIFVPDSVKSIGLHCFHQTKSAMKILGYKGSYIDTYVKRNNDDTTGAYRKLNFVPVADKVNFKANGGKGTMAAMKLDYLRTQKLSANTFTKVGYSFDSWNTKADGSGTRYANKAEISKLILENSTELTLYAQWKLAQYKLKYVLNGGKNSASNPTSYTYESETIKLKKASKTGYKFGGWYLDSKFKTAVTEISKGSSGNKTLYAKWTPIKYTIVFDKNGGKGSMKNQTMTYDKKAKLTQNAFKRSGYKFIGWSTDKKAKKATYKDTESVMNLTAKNKESVTLYAVWKKK